MKKTFSFLHGLMLLAAVSLCAAQAGAQTTESRDSKLGKLLAKAFRQELAGGMFQSEDFEKIKKLYYNLTLEEEAKKADKSQTIAQLQQKTAQIVEQYIQQQMMEDWGEIYAPYYKGSIQELEEYVRLWESQEFQSFRNKLNKAWSLTQSQWATLTTQKETLMQLGMNQLPESLKEKECPAEFKRAFMTYWRITENENNLKKRSQQKADEIKNAPTKNEQEEKEKAAAINFLQNIESYFRTLLQNTMIDCGMTEAELNSFIQIAGMNSIDEEMGLCMSRALADIQTTARYYSENYMKWYNGRSQETQEELKQQ